MGQHLEGGLDVALDGLQALDIGIARCVEVEGVSGALHHGHAQQVARGIEAGMGLKQEVHVDGAQAEGLGLESLAEELVGHGVGGPLNLVYLGEQQVAVVYAVAAVVPAADGIVLRCPAARRDDAEVVGWVVRDGIVGGHVVEREARVVGQVEICHAEHTLCI